MLHICKIEYSSENHSKIFILSDSSNEKWTARAAASKLHLSAMFRENYRPPNKQAWKKKEKIYFASEQKMIEEVEKTVLRTEAIFRSSHLAFTSD